MFKAAPTQSQSKQATSLMRLSACVWSPPAGQRRFDRPSHPVVAWILKTPDHAIHRMIGEWISRGPDLAISRKIGACFPKLSGITMCALAYDREAWQKVPRCYEEVLCRKVGGDSRGCPMLRRRLYRRIVKPIFPPADVAKFALSQDRSVIPKVRRCYDWVFCRVIGRMSNKGCDVTIFS